LVSGLSSPTYLTHAFDERLFVTEQGGTIRIIDGGRLLDEPFLDIISRVGSAAFEQGLLSVAFHPNYAENGQFYVNYTDRNGVTIVSRFSVRSGDANLADPASEEILLSVRQPFENHNGGQLQFGPDGMLYIGMGDGGSAGDPLNNGQDFSTLLGSLLRIDVSTETGYQIPFDNPFLDDPAIPDEIWAIGLRNPWRFSFDRKNGDLYLSDVGQSLLEEVNYIAFPSAGGQNFGWNIMEGTNCFLNESCDSRGLTIPVAEYSHQEGGCSISGGYVYRGVNFQGFLGNYFYGDFCSGFIWSLLQEGGGEWVSHLVAQTGLKISSFGEDAAGELYLSDHASGTVYQVQP
jgi:glucose/arabinose dehydrogenase